MYDIVIRNGLVIDGTGTPGVIADVAVESGRIVAIGELATAEAIRTIDATGMVVAPGIVDAHTHYDPQLTWDPLCDTAALHGVTTLAAGNCGFSIAPCRSDDHEYVAQMFARVEGMDLGSLAHIDWGFETFEEFLDAGEGDLQLLTGHREALAEGGGLRGDVVGAAGDHQVAVGRGLRGEREERGGGLKADEFEGAENLELLDVFREVAAGEPEVNELAVRELGKFFDTRFHVVESDAFALRDGGEIDGGFDALVVLNGVGGDRHAEIALGLHHGDPEIAFEADAAVLRPDGLHGT